jgi:hypothetical protein
MKPAPYWNVHVPRIWPLNHTGFNSTESHPLVEMEVMKNIIAHIFIHQLRPSKLAVTLCAWVFQTPDDFVAEYFISETGLRTCSGKEMVIVILSLHYIKTLPLNFGKTISRMNYTKKCSVLSRMLIWMYFTFPYNMFLPAFTPVPMRH